MPTPLRTALLASLGVALLAMGACGCEPEPAALGGPLPDLVEIEIRGEDFQWHVRYPGPDGRLDTPDDVIGRRDLRLPAAWPVRVHLRSEDYIYTLRIPPLGAEEIAVPDLAFVMDLGKVPAGVYPLRGDQMCGYSHPDLIGRVVVEPPADWWRALSEMTTP